MLWRYQLSLTQNSQVPDVARLARCFDLLNFNLIMSKSFSSTNFIAIPKINTITTA